MTKEYLKMADVFIEPLSVREKSPRLLDCCGALAANFLNEPGAKYAAHAINSHDELVAEVERLRGELSAASNALDEVDRVISEQIKNGSCDLDDIADVVSYAIDSITGYVD